MKIKNTHVLSAYKNQVILVNNNGILELPGTKLKVSHSTKDGAVKDFMKIVISDLGQENIKVKEKNVKKLLKTFKADVVSKNKDLILSSTKEKAFKAATELAGILFPGNVVSVAASDLKKGVANRATLYQGVTLSQEARAAIKKVIENKHI
jgi:hypothetical protein